MESEKNKKSYRVKPKGTNLNNSFEDINNKRRNHSVETNRRGGNFKKSIVMNDLDAAKFDFVIYKGQEDDSYKFNYDALLDCIIDNRVDQKMSKFEEKIDDLEKKFKYFVKNDSLAMPKKQEFGEIGIEDWNFDKVKNAIRKMEDNDDIRVQIQCVTRVLNQLDILRKTSVFDKNKRKLTAFLRSVMKINCDRKIFNEEQLSEFKNIILLLQDRNIEFDNLVMIEKRLRESGLRTMISWE